MAAQWSQQLQASHNQIYNGYHQQTQQYPSPHNGAYHSHHPYQSNAQAGPQQHHVRPSPNSCYNCGAAEHWAQDCPEPRREHPVGFMHRHNQSRPLKRHKPNAPIITKYPVPPHFQHTQGPSQGYGGGQYSQTYYPSQQGPYAPPTPMSTHSPSQPHWQQSPQYQHHQQPFQQGGPYQHSYPTPTAQTPNSYYGTNNNSRKDSPQGPPLGSSSYPKYGLYSQPQGYHGSAFSGLSPGSAVSPTNGYPMNQHHDRNKAKCASTHRTTQKPHQTPRSYSVTPKSHVANSAAKEADENDEQLKILDIPDLPQPNQVVPSGSLPTHLVGRPLPTNFVVADAISPIGPPSPEDEGRCQSKYWGRGTSINIFRNIRDTSYWDDIEKDPIFSSIPDNDHVIALDETLSMYRPHQAEENVREPEREPEPEPEPEPNPEPEPETKPEPEPEPEPESEPEVEKLEPTPELDASSSNNDRDTPDIMDSLENALNASRRKQLDAAKEKKGSLDERPEAPKNTEQVLASLGVTGAPKPIRAPARPYPPPSHEQGTQASSGHVSRSRSRSPVRCETNGSYHRDSRSNSGVGSDQSHDAYDSSNHPDFCDPKQKTFHEQLAPDRHLRSSADVPCSQQLEPPPPPPPSRKHSVPEGPNNSPHSARPNFGDGHMYTEQQFENGNGYGRYATDGHSQSPIKLRSERSVGRKREFDSRDSSDEDETPRRRQADDVTPKLKRRQPKVDAAYSRRW